jgi:lipoprotein-anchoring transpeptidase ErfK/SrfK
VRACGLGYRDGVIRFFTIAAAAFALGAASASAASDPAYDVGPAQAPEAPAPAGPVATTPVPESPPVTTAPQPPVVAPPSPVAPPNPRRSWAGRLLVVATARANPGPGGKPLRLLQPIAPLGAGPVWLQVRGVKVVRGVRWVKVLMPVRPNGATGWVRASDMVFRRIDLRIDVDLSDHRLTLFRKGRKVQSFRIATGTAKNPTPTGRFAIAEVIPTGDPKAFLGPIVMPITGFSETLNEFAGGNGRVAIHGTSLPELIGTRASHGCIRMRNADIRRLNRWVRGGTPVIIRK